MHKLILLVSIFFSLHTYANDTTKLYNPKANAAKDINDAVKLAKLEKKNVLIQVGGNWCVWCLRFNKFVETDAALKKVMDENFVVYHLNYSPENKNLDILARYAYPQRFGFPVFIVLDGDGNRIHTQDSALLEEKDNYDRNDVKTFFENWSTKAMDPAKYKNQ